MRGQEEERDTATDRQHDEREMGKWRRRILGILSHGSDAEETDEAKLRDAIKALDGAWMMRQMPLLGLIAFFLVVLTTLRYQWQKDLIETDVLKKQIEDIAIRSAAVNSELTEKTRQSMIERRLKSNGDSTLTPSTEAPFVMRITREAEEKE